MQINVDLIYPIGSIYMTTSMVSPAVLFGGTWERIKGRCIVGVDENDTDFQTVSKTGGSKYTEKHTHNSTIKTRANGTANYNTYGELMRASTDNGNVENKTNTYSSIGYFGTGDSGNLQPYYTAFIWRRTA